MGVGESMKQVSLTQASIRNGVNFSVANGIGPGNLAQHRLEEAYRERGRGQASVFPLSTVQNGKEIYLHNLGEIFGIYLMGKVKREFQIYDQNEVCGSYKDINNYSSLCLVVNFCQ